MAMSVAITFCVQLKPKPAGLFPKPCVLLSIVVCSAPAGVTRMSWGGKTDCRRDSDCTARGLGRSTLEEVLFRLQSCCGVYFGVGTAALDLFLH